MPLNKKIRLLSCHNRFARTCSVKRHAEAQTDNYQALRFSLSNRKGNLKEEGSIMGYSTHGLLKLAFTG